MTELDLETASRVFLDATELWTEDERRAVLEQLDHLRVYVNTTKFSLESLLSAPDQLVKNPRLFLGSLEVVERHTQSLREKAQRVRELQTRASYVVDSYTR